MSSGCAEFYTWETGMKSGKLFSITCFPEEQFWKHLSSNILHVLLRANSALKATRKLLTLISVLPVHFRLPCACQQELHLLISTLVSTPIVMEVGVRSTWKEENISVENCCVDNRGKFCPKFLNTTFFIEKKRTPLKHNLQQFITGINGCNFQSLRHGVSDRQLFVVVAEYNVALCGIKEFFLLSLSLSSHLSPLCLINVRSAVCSSF